MYGDWKVTLNENAYYYPEIGLAFAAIVTNDADAVPLMISGDDEGRFYTGKAYLDAYSFYMGSDDPALTFY